MTTKKPEAKQKTKTGKVNYRKKNIKKSWV